MPVAFVKSAISGARTLVTSDQSTLTTCSPLAVGPLPQEPSRPLARATPLAVPTARRKVRRLRGLRCVTAPMVSAPVAGDADETSRAKVVHSLARLRDGLSPAISPPSPDGNACCGQR